MASFDELQALAAARSKASQEKLAAERASREAAEKAKKLAFEEKARLNLAREREALVAKEKKRKREEEERKKMEEEKVEREKKREREIKFREAEELSKFRNASQKALNKVGSSSMKSKKPASKKRSKGPRDDSVSPPPHMREHSTLTREEKRQRKEAAMLGLSSSSSASSSRRKNVSGVHTPRELLSQRSTSDALVPLGTQKRDNRSVDQIERDLIAARQAKLKLQGSKDDPRRGNIDEEKRIDQELEAILRRKRAMEMKRLADRGPNTMMGDLPAEERRETRVETDDPRRRRRRSSSPVDISQRKSRPPVGIVNQFGLSPADYLPGAPIKVIPRAAVRGDDSRPKKAASAVAKADPRGKEKEKEKSGPPKKETPREKFLREEAERKKQRQGDKKALDSDGLSDSEDEDEDESNEEEYESESGEGEEEEEDDDPRASRSAVSQEIWKMFNRRDKSEYLARDIDSDDEDMEADMESVRREEMRSAHLARLEDQREEEELRKKEREKARRKLERSRT